MEDVVFSPASMTGALSDTAMDCIDELFLDGCWLETTDGSEFLNFSPSTSNAFLDAPSALTTGASEMSNQEERPESFLPENFNLQFRENMIDFCECSNQLGNYTAGGSEPFRRWWIGPRANSGSATSVMQRLIQAVMNMKNFTIDKDVLVQLWVPVNRVGRRMLVTDEQPFSLNPNSWRLANYRDISVKYHFSAEEDSKDIVGLPGRVFLGKVPEWTPDVQFFRSDEYPRVDHAQQYDVRGTVAIPVFEQGSRTCLGVIEVVTTTQKISYGPEFESVRKALESVNLTSSVASSPQNVTVCSKSYEAALPEIKEVLRRACETQKLPLGQTWASCIQQGKQGCRHSSENYVNCVSTLDDACYIADHSIKAFHEACSEHHLLKGQGVIGEAFMTNQPCFSPNITAYTKTDYPLSHHARIVGLYGAVAIRLRSIHTGNADFVLEFFLPKDCKDIEEQKKMLNSLSVIIQDVCRSLRVVTDQEVSEESDSQVSEVIVTSYGLPNAQHTPTERNSPESSFWTAGITEIQQGSKVTSVVQMEKTSPMLIEKVSEVKQHQEDSTFNEVTISNVNGGKIGNKRRTKAERKITLDVLRQYFAGSLKDAAKSLGVCPTTLKRICRQHGIQRWPSRKLKKVDHSLKKLQNAIDSVHGGSGAFQIGSFYTNFPELAPKSPGSSTIATLKLRKPVDGDLDPQATILITPSTSCSQSSSSSHSYSSEKQQHVKYQMSCPDKLTVDENLGDGMLRRVRSHIEIHASGQEGIKPLPRTGSLKSLKREIDSDKLLPKGNGQIAQELDAQRIKVTYGDEKIRFRLQKQWRFKDLLEEIARRFNIDDIGKYDLKYLDDDSEWVLLTCDADLEECLDVCGSSEGNTIKLKLQASHNLLDRYCRTRGPS